MSSRHELHLDWCSHEAAKYAVEKWHYTKILPAGKLIRIGVWERKTFIGCVIFGRGANNNIGKPYSLEQTEVCELVRVSLRKHESSVSRIMSISLRLMKKICPKMRLVISYADPIQGHAGTIYQASNWIYCGKSQPQRAVVINGKQVHKRTACSLFGTIKGMERTEVFSKHKYLMPLDEEMRSRITPLARPYPKRAESAESGTPDFQSGRGGANPTSALSDCENSDE